MNSKQKMYRTFPVIFAFGILCSAAMAPAQSARIQHRKKAQTQNQNQPFVFGDITLSNYDTLSVELGKIAEAKGEDTTVDAVNTAQNSKFRLLSSHITAYMIPKTNNQVERIEADGNVRFQEIRTDKTSGSIQKLSGTGTKGTYYKQQDKIALLGPVTFHAEEPSVDHKALNTIDGDANSATYDNINQVLTFTGNVNVTIVVPESLEAPAKINGQEIQINLGIHPYKIDIKSGKVKFHPKEQPPTKKP
jgi:lipopolysaccharide export system protein LptA